MQFEVGEQKKEFMYKMQEFAQKSVCTSPSDALERVLQVKLVAFHQLPVVTLACLPASAEMQTHILSKMKWMLTRNT